MLSKHATFEHAFGTKAQVNPIHLFGHSRWLGRQPDRRRLRRRGNLQERRKTVYTMKVPAQVPVDAFWSISVYNAKVSLRRMRMPTR